MTLRLALDRNVSCPRTVIISSPLPPSKNPEFAPDRANQFSQTNNIGGPRRGTLTSLLFAKSSPLDNYERLKFKSKSNNNYNYLAFIHKLVISRGGSRFFAGGGGGKAKFRNYVPALKGSWVVWGGGGLQHLFLFVFNTFLLFIQAPYAMWYLSMMYNIIFMQMIRNCI